MTEQRGDTEGQRASPLISAWGSPRKAVQYIVADRPGYLVLPLAVAGGAASVAAMLSGYGAAGEIMDWRALLACIVGGGIISIVNLYFFGTTVGWLGRKFGGQASNAAVRTAIAWGMLPNILGFVVVMLMVAAWRMVGGTNPFWSSVANGVTGLCELWSIFMTLLMLSAVERFGTWRTIGAYTFGLLLPSTMLALLVRTFLFHPFTLPAASMCPTLLPGDDVFAAKYPYGYSRYSLPFSLPPFSGRIFGSVPARGDVIVFRTRDGVTDFTKRVVGLPGDRIQMKAGELHINDMKVKRERAADFMGSDVCGGGPALVKRWRETLPNGASFETIDCVPNGFYDNTDVYTVPSGHLFVLGDNRDNSTDSRVLSMIGYVPLENVIGRVDMIFFSRGKSGYDVRDGVRYDRIGTVVR